MNLSEIMSGQPAEQTAQASPQDAVAEIDNILSIVSGITDEASYQAAKQQYAQMGGDMEELSPSYNQAEIEDLKGVLMHLKDAITANTQPQNLSAMMGG